MDDLIAFIRARCDEDEAAAKVPAGCDGNRWTAGKTAVLDKDGTGAVAMWIMPGVADHIARHDPARVLREVEAHRAMMFLVWNRANQYDGIDGTVADTLLSQLAAIWSDHPDYRPKWATR